MNYANTVEKVMSLLKEKKVYSSSRKSHRDCYESLRSYLDKNSTKYTVKVRDEWFSEIKKSLPPQRCAIWIRYIYQLEEMDSSGTVSDRRLYLNQSIYDKLPVSWKDDLDFYLEDCCKRYTKRTLELTRTYCSEGLLIFDEMGVVNISDISCEAVLILVNTKMYQSDETRNVILNYTARIIQFYEKIGKCTKPYRLLFGFSNWIRYLAGSFTKTRNRIVKRTGRDPVLSTPCRIRQTALPALSHQFHPFIQGTPWGTFVSHNETSMCSEFLSPINGME